jgi:hypothetical protein
MFHRNLAVFLMFSTALLWGQPPPSTVTVAVSPSSGSTVQPDQAVFSISVNSGFDRGLEEIAALLANLGITAADLTGIEGSAAFGNSPQMIWTFQLTAPLAKATDTVASLTSLQKALPQNATGLSMSFSLQNLQVSAPQPQSCDFNSLMASARSQARTMASAAGLTVGSVVSVSSGVSPSVPNCGLTVTFGLVVLFNQPPPTAITVTASPAYTLTPQDQAQIEMTVTSGVTAGPDDVSGALAAGGISGVSLSGVNSTMSYVRGTPTPTLQWNFTLLTPFTKLKSTLAQLITLQKNFTTGTSGLSMNLFLQGPYGLGQSQPACDSVSLLSDARAQARTVAAAAGLTAGNVLTLSNGFSPGLAVPNAVVVAGRIGTVAYQALCVLTAQFQLF